MVAPGARLYITVNILLFSLELSDTDIFILMLICQLFHCYHISN